jgi:hypothetical protein
MDQKNKKTPMPYQVPDGFFEAFPNKVMDALSRKPQAPPKKPLRLLQVTAIAASVLLLTLVLYPMIQAGRKAPFKIESTALTDPVAGKNEPQGPADTPGRGNMAATPETYSAAPHAALDDLDQLLLELSDEELEALTADFLQDAFYQNPL